MKKRGKEKEKGFDIHPIIIPCIHETLFMNDHYDWENEKMKRLRKTFILSLSPPINS